MYHIIIHRNGELSVYEVNGDDVEFLGRGVPPFELPECVSDQFRAAWYEHKTITDLLPYAELEVE